MPTGRLHNRTNADGTDATCRCTIGEDHGGRDETDSPEESISVYDAADIWLSNGMDEDYSFGFDEDELRRAAGQS